MFGTHEVSQRNRNAGLSQGFGVISKASVEKGLKVAW